MERQGHFLMHLKTNLTDESKAYGYTLVIWGSGTLLIKQFGLPGFPLVMAFVAGALTGFAILAFVAYQGMFRGIVNKHDDRLIVASMIHYIAALGTVGLSMLLHVTNPLTAFFLVGVNASVMYNVLLLVETAFGEHLRGAEETIHEISKQPGAS